MGFRISDSMLSELERKGLIASAQEPALPPEISEEQFLQAVLQTAKRAGWLCYHTRDSRKSAAGFPDLVLVRATKCLFLELKTDRGIVTAAQRTWLDRLTEAGMDARVCRPHQWPEIAELLGAS